MYSWPTDTIAFPTPVHVGNAPYTVQVNGSIIGGQTLTSLSITGGIPLIPNTYYQPNTFTYQLSGFSANACHTFTVVNQIDLAGLDYSVYWGAGATGTGNSIGLGSSRPGPNGTPIPTTAGPYYTP